MDRRKNERLSFSLSGAGDDDMAGWHLLVVRYVEGKRTEESISHSGRVKMDSGSYDAEEWIREVLIQTIEAL